MDLVFDAIYNSLALMALLAMVVFVIPWAIADTYRQAMYSLRDRLFMDAFRGEVSFEDSAYGMLRKMANSSIQSTKLVTPLQIWIVGLAAQILKPKRSELRGLSEATHRCIRSMPDSQQRDIYRRYYNEIRRLTNIYMLVSMWPVLIVAVPTYLAAWVAVTLSRSVVRFSSKPHRFLLDLRRTPGRTFFATLAYEQDDCADDTDGSNAVALAG